MNRFILLVLFCFLLLSPLKGITPNTPIKLDQNGINLQNLYDQIPDKSLATAWVNFNSSAVVLDSLNVSSVTRKGVGNFVVNFKFTLKNSSYTPIITTTERSGSFVGIGTISEENPPTTKQLEIFTSNTNTNLAVDPNQISVIIFGGR